MPGKQQSDTQECHRNRSCRRHGRDLDAAAANWKRLGFTISPRGTHSAHMGTGNYTIMLDPDYIELLGVLTDTEHNAPARAFLANREGIERVAFTAVDSADGAEEIRARGYEPIGPTDFERPVTMPDGSVSAAKFTTFQWPVAEAPGGLRIFACQHKTRETVWIPELMKHANGAQRLKQVLIASPEPARGRRPSGAPDRRQHQDGAGRRHRGALGLGPRRFCLSHQGPVGQALSGSLVRRIARARQRRHGDRDLRSCGGGEGGRERRCSQRRRRLRSACGGQRHVAGVCGA